MNSALWIKCLDHLQDIFSEQQFNTWVRPLQVETKENNFYICVNENEWQHNFEPSNYISAFDLSENNFHEILDRNFLKISKNIELNKWNDTPEFLGKSFSEIIEFLKISFPAGEKDLSPEFPKVGSDL